MYYIYLIKNIRNNKIYIGKRKCPNNKLPKNDNYFGSGIILRKAFKKYGKENFTKEILVENIDSVEEINLLEQKFITSYESYKREIGYNRTMGGDGGETIKFFTQKEMEEFSEKLKGRVWTEESKKKISDKLKGKKKTFEHIEKVQAAGKNWRETEEGKKMISSCKEMGLKNKGKRMGKDSPHAKKVICIETNEIFCTLTEAHQKTGALISKISECCRGKRNTAGGFHWEYFKDEHKHKTGNSNKT